MKFLMNNREWNIIQIDKEQLIDLYKLITKDENVETVYGLTNYEKKIVYINYKICKEKMIQTLKHELMHVYIEEYCAQKEEYDEEELCNISANSHDIIHKIVEDYLKNTTL